MVRLALFGCGRIGKVHAESIAAHPQAELIWVCDPAEEAARSLAGRYGAAAGRDADVVLKDPRVDAVVVAIPHPDPRRPAHPLGTGREGGAVREADRS